MPKSPRLPAGYDPNKYPHPSVAVDLTVFALADQQLQILLIKRGVDPFKESWALPGGFVGINEDLTAAATRELVEETGLKKAYLEQLYTFGEPQRDPRTRVISVAYFALLPRTTGKLTSGTDATAAKWHDINDLPKLAFDHQAIVEQALNRLRAKAQYSTIVKGLLPATFTLGELQRAYETLLGHLVDKRNFRKKIVSLRLVEPTGKERDVASSRPAALYRFAARDVVIFD